MFKIHATGLKAGHIITGEKMNAERLEREEKHL
jgi:hypothetical protein